jgi:hypothetical protein
MITPICCGPMQPGETTALARDLLILIRAGLRNGRLKVVNGVIVPNDENKQTERGQCYESLPLLSVTPR